MYALQLAGALRRSASSSYAAAPWNLLALQHGALVVNEPRGLGLGASQAARFSAAAAQPARDAKASASVVREGARAGADLRWSCISLHQPRAA